MTQVIVVFHSFPRVESLDTVAAVVQEVHLVEEGRSAVVVINTSFRLTVIAFVTTETEGVY
eukprot:m.261317 g.261317  ORF g.261317 m.261317 type:complete len:61 (-) comp44321_c0_seq1:3-185(-)